MFWWLTKKGRKKHEEKIREDEQKRVQAEIAAKKKLEEEKTAEKAAAEKAAAEKAAAEKAAAEKAAAHVWELSDREKEIVAALGKHDDC